MITEDVSHYLIRCNKFNNTKLSHIRKNFHNTIIRKFTSTIKCYRSSFNRINRRITMTNTITFINLRFIFPFNRNISCFWIKFIIFFYNTCSLHSYFIYISKNTTTCFTSPNYMPNFIKITIIFRNTNRLFLK